MRFAADIAERTSQQGERLRALLAACLPANPWIARKFREAGLSANDVRSPADLAHLPFTTKQELLDEQAKHPPYGRLWTDPLVHYARLHRTSGTSGRPLYWLDTPQSWDWLIACWEQIFNIVGIGKGDRLFFPFSFGPFLAFWAAFDAAARLGLFVLPGGGMTSSARLRFLLEHQATVVLATPTYALHLAETARVEGLDLTSSTVRLLLVAGEPGGSIPATRTRLESEWGARVVDHSGMTEIGPLGIECLPNPGGLHLLESECIAEVVDPETLAPTAVGELGELVLTNLGRAACPLLRYRTGDLVRLASEPCPCGLPFSRLAGGILGRCDDMIHVRGNNLYPGAIEAVVRRFPEVAEYRVEVERGATLTEVWIQVEPTESASGDELARRIDRALHDELLFRARVSPVAPGTLPRFELKARRWFVR
jgi:phenylacetate-CoA ligase